jgi:hypothetical protein
MKTFLSISLTLLLALLVQPSQAQQVIDQQNLLQLGDRTGSNAGRLLYTRAGSYYGIMGTPYLNDKWTPAVITALDGKKHENTPVLYNAHYDLIEAVVGKDTLILNSRLITSVEMPVTDANGVRYVKLKNGFTSPSEKIESTNFFEILYEGSDFTLMKKHYKFLKPSDFNAAYNTGSKFDEFQMQHTTFVKTPDGQIQKVRTNRRDILRLMGDKSKQVEDYIKKEKLKYDDDTHLGRIFAYYETL